MVPISVVVSVLVQFSSISANQNLGVGACMSSLGMQQAALLLILASLPLESVLDINLLTSLVE